MQKVRYFCAVQPVVVTKFFAGEFYVTPVGNVPLEERELPDNLADIQYEYKPDDSTRRAQRYARKTGTT